MATDPVITECEFDFLDDDEVCRASVVEVSVSSKRRSVRGSLADPRMGVLDRGQLCPTCRKRDCKGHFGHIKLSRKVWRFGALSTARSVHRSTCEWCARPRWLPMRESSTRVRTHLGRLENAVSKYQEEDGGWEQKPERQLAAIAAAFVGEDRCPWTAENMEAAQETIEEISAEFDAAHGTSGAVMRMFDIPPCGLPLPTYRDVDRLFLVRSWEDESVLEGLPPLVRRRMTAPLTPEDSLSCFRRLGVYASKVMGFASPKAVCGLVTGVQVVPPPRMRMTSFGAGEDDLTFFLREVLKTELLLRAASEQLRKATLGLEGCSAAQARAAREVVAVGKRLLDLRQRKINAVSRGEDPSSWDDQLFGKAAEYFGALRTQDAACKSERANEDMLWKVLSCRIADIVNPEMTVKISIPGAEKLMGKASQSTKRNRRGMRVRMSGKQGRFRKTILGKRVNDSARSVVDPAPPEFDPYELGVPRAVANVLVVPERVSRFNLEAMKRCVRIGNGKTGGAAMIFEPVEVSVTDGSPMGGLMEGYTKDRGKPVSLKMMSDAERARFADEELGVGFTVLRHIQDGDVVMFNRQPTLHRGSWMAFLARVTDKLSFQLPVVVTSPFNADFDGDEMNLHVALSQLAQGEASDVMFMPNMIRGAGTNSPRCGMVMGDNAAAFDMTSPDSFLDRSELMQAMMQVRHDTESEEYRERPSRKSVFESFRGPGMKIPQPAVMIPRRRAQREGLPENLWTGSQVVSLIIPSGLTMRKPVREQEEVVIHGGSLVKGRLCKQTVGASKGGIVDCIAQIYGPWCAAKFLGDAHRLLSYWISIRGGSTVVLADCVASRKIREKVQDCVAACKRSVESLARNPILAGEPREVLQPHVLRVFNRARQEIQRIVMANADENNDVWRMIYTGSKGKPANLMQILGCVGAQTFNGGLPLEFFVPTPACKKWKGSGLKGSKRTFFFCEEGESSLESLGFARTSFSQGLDIVPMLWQVAAGRVGLIDTAVKTSRVGYAFRTMYTGTNSNAVAADGTVRNSSNKIMTFAYGDDGLDADKLEVVSCRQLEAPPTNLEPEERAVFLAARDMLMSATLHEANRRQREPSAKMRQPFNMARMISTVLSGNVLGTRVPGQLTSLFDSCSTLDSVVVAANRLMREVDPLRDLLRVDSLQDVAKTFELGPSAVSVADRTAGSRAYLTMSLLRHKADLTPEQAARIACCGAYLHGKAMAPHGDAVGATAASSINEPLQQMTMNTFHSTGQTIAAVVSGLPAMKQIIEAKDTRQTARATVYIEEPFSGSKSYADRLAASVRSLWLHDVVKRDEVERCELSLFERLASSQPTDPEYGKTCFKPVKDKPFRATLQAAIRAKIGSQKKSWTKRVQEEEEALSRLPSAYRIRFELRRGVLHDRGLEVSHVRDALRKYLRDDAVVTSSSCVSGRWFVTARPVGATPLYCSR